MDQWTPRVTARAELASLLKSKYLPQATAAGIKPTDLEEIITQGNIAKQADNEQKEQIATITVERAGKKERAAELIHREDQLRDRLPAVIGHLEQSGKASLAAFLQALSFARFRYRELPPASPTQPSSPVASPPSPPTTPSPEEEEVRRVARVEREDIVSRASGLAALCRALLKPGREPIVGELTERGLSAQWLTQLADDADAIARGGQNFNKAADATSREAAAAGAQRRKWQQIRRMMRKAVAGVAELESKFAHC